MIQVLIEFIAKAEIDQIQGKRTLDSLILDFVGEVHSLAEYPWQWVELTQVASEKLRWWALGAMRVRHDFIYRQGIKTLEEGL